MKFKVIEKEVRIALQQAKRQNAIEWGRFKFIHAKYLPIRFRLNCTCVTWRPSR